MSYPYGYEVTKIKSNQTINYDSFSGDILYSFTNEAEKWISPKNTSLTVQLRICMTDETAGAGVHPGTLKPIINAGSRAGPTQVSIPYINNNPVPCLFSSLACEIGNQTISMNQNVPSINTMYKTLYESQNEQNTVNSLCPINVMNVTDIDITGNKPITKLYDVYGINYANNALTTLTSWLAAGANAPLLSNHQIYALNNQRGFNRFTED